MLYHKNIFRNNNGQKPILVFDLMAIIPLLNQDKVSVLYGGRHIKYFNIIDRLFRKLSEVAELVFFEDGPVVTIKYDTWIDRKDSQYKDSIEIIDQIRNGTPIEEVATFPNLPLMNSHKGIVKKLAKSYGRQIISMTRECDAELAQFASNNQSVLAVLANDSDFLIFKGSWRYFSLADINMETLKTMEFNKTALRTFLNLDDRQLMVFSTIAGNDIVKYDDVRRVHYNKFGGHKGEIKFPQIAAFIRENINLRDFNGMVEFLGRFLFGRHQQPDTCDRIYESLLQYSMVSSKIQ